MWFGHNIYGYSSLTLFSFQLLSYVVVLCLPTFATLISDAENVKAFAKGAAGGAETTASHYGASHLDHVRSMCTEN